MLESLEATSSILLGTTATVAVIHTVLGVDHSLPFVVLARARGWTLGHTVAITALCGAGHVASSVLIGVFGVAIAATFDSLVWIESARAELAAALLIGFGLAYAAWAGWGSLRGITHSHLHAHADGIVHDHPHDHHVEHMHPHPVGASLTQWALFMIFVFGPCEPLIPLMIVPAMSQSWMLVAAVVGVFGALTIGTMVAAVILGYRGLHLIDSLQIARHADVLAGLVVAASGAAVLFFGI